MHYPGLGNCSNFIGQRAWFWANLARLFVIQFDSIKENSMKVKQINILVGFLLLVAGGLSACYPGGPTSVEERDSVVTVFDQSANFAAIRTYAMPDQIAVPADSEEISD